MIIKLTGLPRDKVYRRFRLPGAPAPVDCIAGVDSYNVQDAIAFLYAEFEKPI